jgi:FKBP-type peptidyl-prolyl cis-trans isomerase FkpA
MIQVPRFTGLVAAVVAGLVAGLAVSACGSSSSSSPSSTTSAPFSQTDLRVGTGADAVAGKRLTVNYTGWLHDSSKTDNKGTQFDSSLGAGRSPFTFTLGAGQVIKGWDQGFAGMKVGGQRRLVIPPELGYGASGSGGVIPPNATLVFDVELLDVQ